MVLGWRHERERTEGRDGRGAWPRGGHRHLVVASVRARVRAVVSDDGALSRCCLSFRFARFSLK